MDFSGFTRIIGRGPTLSRPLTREEAREAMAMVLSDNVDPVQLGGFLLVLRQRGETAEELAGFVDAVHARIGLPANGKTPDIDWPSYADHHRQQPWFVLSAMLLASFGIKVLMHGIEGTVEGCAPTRLALEALGISPSRSLAEASSQLINGSFAYIDLADMSPETETLFHYKPLLGVRSVANTFVRDLNPLRSNFTLVGIVHSPYRQVHQNALGLLGQPNAAVFKGIGGEAQRNPFKSVQIATLNDGHHGIEDWPATLTGEPFLWREEDLSPQRIAALWEGRISHPSAEASIIATAAVVLKLSGRAETRTEAQMRAQSMWQDRHDAQGHSAFSDLSRTTA
ncbi:glycosyl transferase family protein [Thalassospiraceae bacterium LMO-JJ14]|nr:glycosyl transferase family protein [Thalassospiraceae bacterium LMO-JJ14]